MSIQHPFIMSFTAADRRATGGIGFCFTALLLFSLLITGFTATPAAAADTEKTETLLILGDSISAGYGLRQKQGWVDLLKQRLNDQHSRYQVVNASISGETTQGGLTRLPKLLRQHQPDLVLLELGGNDGLRGLPLNLMQNNLSRMIDMSRNAGATPVLLGIQLPPNYGRRYTEAFAAVYPRLGEQKEVAVVPFILDKIAIYPELMQSDGIHPKAEAQRQILDNIWPTLEPLLSQVN